MAMSEAEIHFTVTPPSVNTECIQEYNVTFNGSDDSTGSVAVPATAAAEIRGGFDLCVTRYNFTVVAETAAGAGEESDVVSLEPKFLGEFPGGHVISRFYSE